LMGRHADELKNIITNYKPKKLSKIYDFWYTSKKVKSATKLLYIGFSFDDEQRTAVILNLQSATTVLLFKVLNKLWDGGWENVCIVWIKCKIK
jgi:hypothetical protein